MWKRYKEICFFFRFNFNDHQAYFRNTAELIYLRIYLLKQISNKYSNYVGRILKHVKNWRKICFKKSM